jgi:cardiolipin synthase
MIRLTTLSPLEHLAFVAAGLLTYVVVTRMRRQRRPPYAALAWVMGIAAFPYLGVPIFLVFGTRKVVRPATEPRPVPPGDWAVLAPPWATRLLAALGVAEAHPQAQVRFQADGDDALRVLQDLMRSARRTLDVCTYVLGDDEVGAQVANILCERARAGVRVRLLVDAIGSLKSARSHDAQLKAAGVQTRLFMPLRHNPRRSRTNMRNHRKLVVADGEHVWGGGRNLANEYFIGSQTEAPWLDLSFTATGALAVQAHALFEGDWRLARGLNRTPRLGYAERVERYAEPAPAPGQTLPRTSAPPAQDDAADLAAPLAQWVPSGPDFHDDVLHALLVSAAFHATDRLLLATPYFVPDDGLLEALTLAARRGVRVLLLLPGRSNHRLPDIARGRAVREMVEAGAEVRLLPYMLHAKAVVVDQALALCGSANLDSRSLFVNFEAMAAFYSPQEIEWLARWIDGQAGTGTLADAAPPSWGRDILEGMVTSVAYQL